MNFRKIAAVGAAFVMAAGIVTGVPTSNENVTPFAITAEAADSKFAAPKNVKVTAGDGKVTLTWDKVKGADAYRVYLYNADTKKYEKCKFVKGEKAAVTGLENGKTYKFKVAAAVKSGKSYKTGTVSAAVSAKPKAAKGTSASSKLTEVNLKTADLKGTWEYYDFRELKKYTSYEGYVPPKEEPEFCGMFSSIYIKDVSNVIFTANDYYYSFFLYAKINNGKFSGAALDNKYKTFSYGDDLYMFVQFINGDGEHTYVFKKTEPIKKKRITDISKLEGSWTGIDFISQVDFECIDLYDPELKFWGDTIFFKSADIKDGKIDIKLSDGSSFGGNLKIGKNDIEGSKYAVYEINNEMYLFIEFINGDGNNIYVLKKNK